VGRDRVAVALIKICSPYAMSTYSFSNLPNQFVVTMWTKNVKTLMQMCDDLEKEGLFESVVPNVLLDIRYYEEINARKWVETMPIKRPKGTK
jgi:hypothetical protein